MALHYVYVSARRVQCARVSGRGMVLTGSFDVAPGEAVDPAGFMRLLAQHRRDRYVVIADVVDEEMALETLPRLKRADRMTLIERRLEQRFRDRPLRTSRPLTPPKGVTPVVPVSETGPMPVLLTALGNESGVQVWLAAMQAAGARVAGLYTPALLAAAALARVGKGMSGLLVTAQPGGIRQTLLVDGRVRFSRLAALNPEGVTGATVGAECERTLQYLAMNKILPVEMLRAGVARVWCVVDGLADPAALPQTVGVDSQTRFPLQQVGFAHLHGPRVGGEVVAALGGAALWLDERLTRTSGTGYADRPLTRHGRVARWRQWLWAGSGGVFAATAALWLAVWNIGLIAGADPHQERERRLAEDRREYEAGLAVPGIGGNEMRQLVEAADKLQGRAIAPVRVFQQVSEGLGDDASVRLVSITWQRGADLEPVAMAASQGPIVPAPSGLPSMGPGGLTPLPPLGNGPIGGAPAAAPKVDTGLKVTIRAQVLQVTSRVDANRRAQAFVERLRTHCGCEVLVKTLPFESGGAGGSAPGSGGGGESGSAHAGFTVTMDLDRLLGDKLVGGADAHRS